MKLSALVQDFPQRQQLNAIVHDSPIEVLTSRPGFLPHRLRRLAERDEPRQVRAVLPFKYSSQIPDVSRLYLSALDREDHRSHLVSGFKVQPPINPSVRNLLLHGEPTDSLNGPVL